MDKVAVVILNWNGMEMLHTFLPSVVKYSDMEGVTVYLADNASTDASVSMVRTAFPSVRIIALDENYGYADGYNIALNRIQAEYAILLNSDVEVTENWLQPMIEYMDEHPIAAACQPKIRSWRNKDSFEYAGACGGFLDKYGYPFCRGRVMNTVEKDNGQYDSVIPVFWATGASLMVRLLEYHEAGGLDGRFFAHMEEIDLCWRFRSRGLEVACIPESVVYHVGAGTLKKENPQKTYLNFRNNLVMLYKNLPANELSRVMLVRRWLDYIAGLSFLLKGQIENAKAVFKAISDFNVARQSFSSARVENLEKTIVDSVWGKVDFSILLKYYIRRKKYFSQLRINTDER
ncbi:glycosyltransferase family 2 protein [Bacteroides sp. 224]|uniref:glycosyltransferase family 2 protein n=1 Tax=Bacteroides sp. 224 TaxID=2302936 RepID=UPI0013D5CB19|nr:glycosyltransferase family 2 protein [Bacteroides sp. 224]NDV65416.1 glycosyltransferase family 2 protein [Bacteroides sp. 224]